MFRRVDRGTKGSNIEGYGLRRGHSDISRIIAVHGRVIGFAGSCTLSQG